MKINESFFMDMFGWTPEHEEAGNYLFARTLRSSGPGRAAADIVVTFMPYCDATEEAKRIARLKGWDQGEIYLVRALSSPRLAAHRDRCEGAAAGNPVADNL